MSRTGVRAAIAGIFALLATAITVAEVRSQPGRPGFPRPGGMPGRPGGVTGMPGGVPGGGFRGPQFEDVWVCGGCQAELGRGPIKPSYTSCPKCGVRLVNGGPGAGRFAPPAMPGSPARPGGATMPGASGSPPPQAAPNDPDLVPRGAHGVPTSATPPGSATPAVASSPLSPGTGSTPEARPADTSSASSGSGSKTGALILKIMIGVFALLFLLGVVGGTILIVSANKGRKPPPKRRRARDLDDDDDD